MIRKSIRSDLERIDSMKDEDIDFSDSPELDESFFSRAVIFLPKPKKTISLRVDLDVLEWFKSQGKGYQTKIIALMKAYMLDQKKKASA
ncbi:MAG: BrnA antitoxin family protein [Candidatus Riflebacteria bacterium]|nr:BrnA antitoxin family protein [Candidatus Riflebacteria bacterium]